MDLIELGQVYGTWGAVVVFALFLIYQTLKDYLKNKREKIKNIAAAQFQALISEQMSENAQINKELLIYLKTISQEFADEITESQARIFADCLFDASKYFIISQMIKIMNENHLTGNEREIKAKIKQIIQNRFHKDVLSLKEYTINKNNMSTGMKEKWKEYTIQNSAEIILQEKGEKTLTSTISNAYDGFKFEFLNSFF